MELLEINQYSQCYYSPKSKENIKGDEAKKYRKRLFYGKGLNMKHRSKYSYFQIILEIIK